MRWRIAAMALTCAACEARLGGNNREGSDATNGDGPLLSGDGTLPDTMPGPFGAPAKLSPAADPVAREDDGTLSHSGLELVYAVVDTTDNTKDLFYASRPDLQSPFGAPTKLPFSAAGSSEETPRFAIDDLTLFFAKSNGANNLDIHRVTRPTAGSTNWSAPSLVAGVNSTGVEKWFMPCTGNRYLMIVGADIAEGTLGGGAPQVVADLSSAQSETGPYLTDNCLTVYFASTRPDGTTNRLYTATRPAIGQPWTTPALVTEFAMLGGNQQDPFLSDDGRTFVFVSDAAGTNDVYISTR